MEKDDFRVLLTFEEATATLTHDDPDDFLYRYQGRVVGLTDEDEHEFTVGTFRVVYADIENGSNHGLAAGEVLDGEENTCAFQELYDLDENHFTARIEKLCGDGILFSNLLVIDRIEILPDFRGMGIADEVIQSLIRRFGHGVGVVAVKAFPLQLEKGYRSDSKTEAWRNEMALDAFPKDIAKAKRSLKGFYKRLGFIPVPKTDLMVANLAW